MIPNYWSTMGIWLHSQNETPDLCAAIFNGDRDIPLSHEGRIIFFRSPRTTNSIIDRFAPASDATRDNLEKVAVHCEIGALLELLGTCAYDDFDVIIDTLNAILDLVAATPVQMPDDIRHTLHRVADYMTFSRSIANCLQETQISVDHLRNSIYWCIGVITAHSRLVE